MKKNILFITGTRADYGKIKSIIQSMEQSSNFEPWIYVCGMHLLEKYGGTYREIIKDNYRNIIIDDTLTIGNSMSLNLASLVFSLTNFIKEHTIDMLVVHGDRTDALGGAIVGALNNIRVAHIEGGEVSGTVDDSLRHAISKLAHFHFVCNNEAKHRLIQMGEEPKKIFVVGSPDIDIMFSKKLPSLNDVRKKYGITFDSYGILMFHPVTTEYDKLANDIDVLVKTAIKSNKQFVVIYPNNDYGSDIILNEYRIIANSPSFRIFPSIRFEYFLTLLKNSEFIIGNSSAGVREACVYGIPSIDIGSRQNNRYNLKNTKNIVHVEMKEDSILEALNSISNYRIKSSPYGAGQSTKRILNVLEKKEIWSSNIQKRFVDIDF